MIQKKLEHGNLIYTDGTYSRKTIYECETIEEFLTLLKQVQEEESQKNYTADIGKKTIEVKEWVNFMETLPNQTRMTEIMENTELVFDDGITEEMWDAAEKAIEELESEEE